MKCPEKKPLFVIAEVGVNHNGDLAMAKKLVDVAVEGGADAVKFQTFFTEDLVLPGAGMASYQIRNTGREETQFEMLKRLELSREQHAALRSYCDQRGIQFLSTPHSGPRSADLLRDVGVRAFKVGSGDLTNLPFLEYLAKMGKPIFLSTGMSDLEEVSEAVRTIRGTGNRELTLLHCTSQYPCPPEQVNLRAMETLRSAFDVPVGYSDHTIGPDAAIVATVMGAVCLEKHITLDRNLPGPDHLASMEPADFRDYVRRVRDAEKGAAALDPGLVETLSGSGEKRPSPQEVEISKLVRKSICTVRDLKRGERLTQENIAIRRPATGMPPKAWNSVQGRRLRRDVGANQPLRWEDLA